MLSNLLQLPRKPQDIQQLLKFQASLKLFYQSVSDQGLCFEGFSIIEIMFPVVSASQCVDFSVFLFFLDRIITMPRVFFGISNWIPPPAHPEKISQQIFIDKF